MGFFATPEHRALKRTLAELGEGAAEPDIHGDVAAMLGGTYEHPVEVTSTATSVKDEMGFVRFGHLSHN